MSKDKCVLITLGHDFLRNIFILGPGYKTDKGIEIGMTIDDIKHAYGPLYTYQTQPQDHTQTYGIYNDNRYSKKFFNYITIEYVSPKNEGLEFVIDKATGKISLLGTNQTAMEVAVFLMLLNLKMYCLENTSPTTPYYNGVVFLSRFPSHSEQKRRAPAVHRSHIAGPLTAAGDGPEKEIHRLHLAIGPD